VKRRGYQSGGFLTLRERAAPWFLTLLALVFLAVGLFMGFRDVRLLTDYVRASRWAPVPARILATELKRYQDSHGAPSSCVRCTYVYTYDGRDYTNSRVGLLDDGDNFGRWHEPKPAFLLAHRDSGEPVTCYVNPASPAEAVRFRELRPELLVLQGGFALVFTTIAVVLTVGAVRERRGARPYPSAPAHVHRPESSHDPLMVWLAVVFVVGVVGTLGTGFLLSFGLRPLLILASLPFVGFVLWVLRAAIHDTCGWLRLRAVHLRLYHSPARLGDRLRGELMLGRLAAPSRPIQVVLACEDDSWPTPDDPTDGPRWTSPPLSVTGGTAALTVSLDIPLPADLPPSRDAEPVVAWSLLVRTVGRTAPLAEIPVRVAPPRGDQRH